MPFEDRIKDHEERRKRALAMGGPDKLKRRRDAGQLNARERIDRLFDDGSFRESGLFGVSYIPEMRAQTPTDGKITGFGNVEGRKVGAVAYDFTVKGSSSSYTNNRKMAHIKDMGTKRGFPVVFMTESTGVRMPDGVRDRVACDGRIQPVWERDGVPFSVGRTQRIVPERTRRVVLLRDGGCKVPGCGHDR